MAIYFIRFVKSVFFVFFTYGLPRGFFKSVRNDGVGVDCHDSTLRANSLNDGIISPSFAEGD